MKYIFAIIGIVFIAALGGAIYSIYPRITVKELTENKYLGKSFKNPMYWAAIINQKPSSNAEEAGLDQLSDRQIIDIGSVIHFRKTDFRNDEKNFEFIPQNQDWEIERVFHVEGNNSLLWIDNRPDYYQMLVKNINNGKVYLMRDGHIELATSNKDSYKRFEDYDKLENIFNSQKKQDKLLVMVDIGNYKDGREILPEDAAQRFAEVERLENLVIEKLPADLKATIKNKDKGWPSIVFEFDRNEFLKLYSYKLDFGVYTKFTPLSLN